jgi:hypothetical protein
MTTSTELAAFRVAVPEEVGIEVTTTALAAFNTGVQDSATRGFFEANIKRIPLNRVELLLITFLSEGREWLTMLYPVGR